MGVIAILWVACVTAPPAIPRAVMAATVVIAVRERAVMRAAVTAVTADVAPAANRGEGMREGHGE